MENVLWADAPAKINLTLDVLGKRADGYHEVETIMHKITLFDRIRIRPGENIKVSSNDQTIAWDHTNLVYRAADLILGYAKKLKGVDIYVEKNIPIAAGLAGGSTDAAATLTGIERLYGLELSEAELFSLAAELGSDVPFCLDFGPKTAFAKGKGEKLEAVEFPMILNLVLAAPLFSLSTAQVFNRLDLRQIKKRPLHARFLQTLKAGSLKEMAPYMENVLETVSLAMCPDIERVKRRIEKAGAIKTLMSGSGPSVFGIFADESKARQAMRQIKACDIAEVFLVSSY